MARTRSKITWNTQQKTWKKNVKLLLTRKTDNRINKVTYCCSVYSVLMVIMCVMYYYLLYSCKWSQEVFFFFFWLVCDFEKFVKNVILMRNSGRIRTYVLMLWHYHDLCVCMYGKIVIYLGISRNKRVFPEIFHMKIVFVLNIYFFLLKLNDALSEKHEQ